VRVGDGGSGFDYPQGDPGAIDGAAAALNAAAGQISTAAGQVSSEGAAVGGSWSGPAAAAFEDAVGSVRSGLDALAGHHRDAAGALTAYATALREAQAAANQAAQAYGVAQQRYDTTMGNLASHPPAGPGAQSALAQSQNQALDGLNNAYGSASTSSSHACQDATHAAQVCAAKLAEIAADIKDTSLHKFLDLMGGPGTVLGALGVTMQVKSGLTTWNLLRAMKTGDWSALEDADPKGYQSVVAIVSKYGENSSEATKAWMNFEATVAKDSFGDMVDAAVPASQVPGGLAGAMDVLGKIGFVTSIAADVMTLADGQSTGMEKTMSAVNLGGVAMAAGGITVDAAAGTTVLAALGATDAVAAAIPVVGEVVIAGTAVYFAYDWASNHWTDITNWADDAGHGLSTAYHAVVNEGEHLVSSGLHEAGNLANGAVNEGHHLLSDLNPF
jgi:uncharacterized protein YukE